MLRKINIVKKIHHLKKKKNPPPPRPKLDHGNTFLPSPRLLQINSVLMGRHPLGEDGSQAGNLYSMRPRPCVMTHEGARVRGLTIKLMSGGRG